MSADIIVGGGRRYDTIDALMQALRDPFPPTDVEWRVQSSGKTNSGPWVRVLAYIDNRAIMERLDAVCGIDGWRNEFRHGLNPGSAVLCGLSFRINSEWITKWDGASETDIEPAKGGISGAMKRAAVQWGIGRYLYNVPEKYAEIVAKSRTANYLKANKDKHGDALYWMPPTLPGWALPAGVTETTPRAAEAEATLKQTPVTTPVLKGAHLNKKLPGSSTSLSGQGGKRIGEVETPLLVTIKDYLIEKGNYQDVVDAIDLTLDERVTGGAG